MASARSVSLAPLEELANAPLQLPSFVQHAASAQQRAGLPQFLDAEADMVQKLLHIITAAQRAFTVTVQQMEEAQEMMNQAPIGGEEWLLGLEMLRDGLAIQGGIRYMLQLQADGAGECMQGYLDFVHAVFALPEVERTTDLLPELVGIVGEFLSIDAKPSDYVSIHALPKLSQAGSASSDGGSMFSLPFPARELEADGSNPADEAKKDEPVSKDE
jgi:hypothetical protein